MRWQDLRDTDFGVLETLAAAWGSYVSAMAEQAEVLAEDLVKGHISVEHYDSATADEVRNQALLVSEGFQDDLHEYASVRIKATLEDAHAALTTYQREVADIIAGIESRRFEIVGEAQNYQVVPSAELLRDIQNLQAPPWLMERAGIGEATITASSDHLNQVIRPLQAVVGDLADADGERFRAVMARAHEADDEAARVLSTLSHGPAQLPPLLGATYDERIDDYEEEAGERSAEFLRGIASGPYSPQGVNRWWSGLSGAERAGLLEAHPELLGPIDGIPSDVRDSANRILLNHEIDRLSARIADLDARGAITIDLEELRDRRDSLVGLRDRVRGSHPDTGQDYMLLGYSSAGDGQAVISIGNPDNADNVNVYVPGTGAALTSLNHAGGIMHRADIMAADAADYGRDQETATVMWMGYDAPDNVLPLMGGGIKPEAAFDAYAKGAAADLSSFVDGVRATTGGERANLTLTGHSYGSTTIGVAAREAGLDADNMIFVGSPGVGVETAADLGIDPRNVWATRNSEDIIEFGMVHGTDPASVGFGGRIFESDATGDGPTGNHSSYWDEGNVAREHLARIVTGRSGG